MSFTLTKRIIRPVRLAKISCNLDSPSDVKWSVLSVAPYLTCTGVSMCPYVYMHILSQGVTGSLPASSSPVLGSWDCTTVTI